jgi:hypothetical protein
LNNRSECHGREQNQRAEARTVGRPRIRRAIKDICGRVNRPLQTLTLAPDLLDLPAKRVVSVL